MDMNGLQEVVSNLVVVSNQPDIVGDNTHQTLITLCVADHPYVDSFAGPEIRIMIIHAILKF